MYLLTFRCVKSSSSVEISISWIEIQGYYVSRAYPESRSRLLSGFGIGTGEWVKFAGFYSTFQVFSNLKGWEFRITKEKREPVRGQIPAL